MRKEELFALLENIDEGYLQQAGQRTTSTHRMNWKAWGAIAACLCLVFAGGILFSRYSSMTIPDPPKVQIANPIIEVASTAEMKEYLDFDVPLLPKEVEAYLVFLEEGYAHLGQVNYADGSSYRIAYGSGDISGIYDGELIFTEEIGTVTIQHYQSGAVRYAIWEQNGFTYSYTFSGMDDDAVKTLVQSSQ